MKFLRPPWLPENAIFLLADIGMFWLVMAALAAGLLAIAYWIG
jgi:hypothetical protein